MSRQATHKTCAYTHNGGGEDEDVLCCNPFGGETGSHGTDRRDEGAREQEDAGTLSGGKVHHLEALWKLDENDVERHADKEHAPDRV